MPDTTLVERLIDIEVLLAELGFAAVADPEGCSILAVPKAHEGPDPSALWRLVTAEPVVCLSEEDLRSDDYLLIALRKLSPRHDQVSGAAS